MVRSIDSSTAQPLKSSGARPGRRTANTLWLPFLTLLLVAQAAVAEERTFTREEVDTIVSALEDRGVIASADSSEGKATPVPAAVSSEAKPNWYDRVTLSGDFRARLENFIFEDKHDRDRLRYRLRIGLKADINDHIVLGTRLATGSGANSANQTLGSGNDFDPDGIFVDRAYLKISPFGKEAPPIGDSLTVHFGKFANMFRPKNMGASLLIWDSDIMPEGAALTWKAKPMGPWQTGLDFAFLVIDENSGTSDPNLFAIQSDNAITVSDSLVFRNQLSYFAFRKLDSDFMTRNASSSTFGGATSGLTGSRHLGLFAYHGALTYDGIEAWPVTLYGNVTVNASARDVGQGKQNVAWGLGFHVGSESESVKLGFGYYEVEADGIVPMIADSDLFDGVSNGKGFRVHASRKVWKNVVLAFELFKGDVLDDGVANTLQTKSPSDRLRIRSDIEIKF